MNSICGSSTRMDEIGVVLLVSPTRAAVAPSRLGVQGPVLTTSDPYAAAVALLTGRAAALVVDVVSSPPQAEAVMALASRRGLPVRAVGPDGRIVGDLPGATAPQTCPAGETYDVRNAAPAGAADLLTPQELAALLKRNA
ncbi:MAG: hypothetical protein GX591_14485 [Planctomycetes bacterium]|nr:hypothetical protein [Planctomycetota bacterium]